MQPEDCVRLQHMLDAANDAVVIAMRHRLIHGYYDVDPDIVWDTVQEDLPPLISALKKALV